MERRELPAGWKICDGKEGRPNLTNCFIYGSKANYSDVWRADGKGKTGVGGKEKHSHGIAHTHKGVAHANPDGKADEHKGKLITTASQRSHDHVVTTTTISKTNSSEDSHLPPHVKFVYIIRMR